MRRRISDSDILETIRVKQPISCTNLGKYYGVTRQAMHLRLQKLERRGMVMKELGAGRRPGLYSTRHNRAWERRI